MLILIFEWIVIWNSYEVLYINIKHLGNFIQSLQIWLCCITTPLANSTRRFADFFCEPLACLFLFNKNNFYSIQRINCKYIDFRCKVNNYIGKRAEAQRKLLFFHDFYIICYS